jgi:hypothetical protein
MARGSRANLFYEVSQPELTDSIAVEIGPFDAADFQGVQ